MNNENNATSAPENTQGQPSLPSPIATDDTAILRGAKTTPSGKGETETERLLQGTRTIEWLQFGTNALLAVIGVAALCIYGGQLKVMKGQLEEIIRQYPEIHAQAVAATTAVKQAAADSIENARRVERQLKIAQQQAEAARKRGSGWSVELSETAHQAR